MPRGAFQAPAEPPAAAGLLVADRDGALAQAPAEEALRRLAAVAVEVGASEAATKERLDRLRCQRVGHARSH